MKKCVIIPDSFKGSLDSIEICQIASALVKEYFPDCQVDALPVADGGEGTVACFLSAMRGEKIELSVRGPYGEPARSFYGRFGDLAVVEMAAAAGLPMAGENRNPAAASTYGVGQLIRHAVGQGARRVILGMGGSCTNDGGCGCAAALGVRFTDRAGKPFVPVGGTLDQIAGIDAAPARELLQGVEITAMCDVENPLYGPSGAAYVFAPQKGADAEMAQLLDEQLRALDQALRRCLSVSAAELPGAGAAGGLGAGMAAFCGATLKPGIETVLDILDFDRRAAGADAVFTGEGKIDGQSLRGKVVAGVAKRAMRQDIPVYAVVGDVGDDADGIYGMGVTAIFSINRLAVPFSVAKQRSKQDYHSTFSDIMRLIRAVERSSPRPQSISGQGPAS